MEYTNTSNKIIKKQNIKKIERIKSKLFRISPSKCFEVI